MFSNVTMTSWSQSDFQYEVNYNSHFNSGSKKDTEIENVLTWMEKNERPFFAADAIFTFQTKSWIYIDFYRPLVLAGWFVWKSLLVEFTI